MVLVMTKLPPPGPLITEFPKTIRLWLKLLQNSAYGVSPFVNLTYRYKAAGFELRNLSP
jgi:hypothetical protein